MASYGLAVLPLGGDDGKRPLVSGWGNWKHAPGCDFIDKMTARHQDANVGIVCGLSRITVLDIDDPAQTDKLIRAFGDTPLKITTPSGGAHLYYRSAGERNANLRKFGIAADIRGIGGMVVAPPSVRPQSSISYSFDAGTWDELSELPVFELGWRELLQAMRNAEASVTVDQQADQELAVIGQGQRNETLFKTMLRLVKNCATLDEAIEAGSTINGGFSSPLTDREVVKTVTNVWQREASGKNWVGQEPQISLPISTWKQFAQKPDALLLFGYLRSSHSAHGEPFPISPDAMVDANVIDGWGRKRYAAARDWLEDHGWIKCLHRGGRARGDASMFVFGPHT